MIPNRTTTFMLFKTTQKKLELLYIYFIFCKKICFISLYYDILILSFFVSGSTEKVKVQRKTACCISGKFKQIYHKIFKN